MTSLEGMVVFGVANTTKTISDSEAGLWIKTSRIPFVKALGRVNEVGVLQPPSNLPLKELVLTEYQLSR